MSANDGPRTGSPEVGDALVAALGFEPTTAQAGDDADLLIDEKTGRPVPSETVTWADAGPDGEIDLTDGGPHDAVLLRRQSEPGNRYRSGSYAQDSGVVSDGRHSALIDEAGSPMSAEDGDPRMSPSRGKGKGPQSFDWDAGTGTSTDVDEPHADDADHDGNGILEGDISHDSRGYHDFDELDADYDEHLAADDHDGTGDPAEADGYDAAATQIVDDEADRNRTLFDSRSSGVRPVHVPSSGNGDAAVADEADPGLAYSPYVTGEVPPSGIPDQTVPAPPMADVSDVPGVVETAPDASQGVTFDNGNGHATAAAPDQMATAAVADASPGAALSPPPPLVGEVPMSPPTSSPSQGGLVQRAGAGLGSGLGSGFGAGGRASELSNKMPNLLEGGLLKRSGKVRARKVRRVVRHVDPWSMLTFSVLFHLCVYAALLLSSVLVWNAAVAAGTIENIEEFVRQLGDYETYEINGDVIFRAAMVIAGILTLASTVLVVLLTVVFNLISDLVGGIRLTVVEEETVRVRRGRNQ